MEGRWNNLATCIASHLIYLLSKALRSTDPTMQLTRQLHHAGLPHRLSVCHELSPEASNPFRETGPTRADGAMPWLLRFQTQSKRATCSKLRCSGILMGDAVMSQATLARATRYVVPFKASFRPCAFWQAASPPRTSLCPGFLAPLRAPHHHLPAIPHFRRPPPPPPLHDFPGARLSHPSGRLASSSLAFQLSSSRLLYLTWGERFDLYSYLHVAQGWNRCVCVYIYIQQRHVCRGPGKYSRHP